MGELYTCELYLNKGVFKTLRQTRYKKSDLTRCKWDYFPNPSAFWSLSLHPLRPFLCVTLSVSSKPSDWVALGTLSQPVRGARPTNRDQNLRRPSPLISLAQDTQPKWPSYRARGMLDEGGHAGARTLSVTIGSLVLTQAASPPLGISPPAGTLDTRYREGLPTSASWPRPFPSLFPTPLPWPRASPHIEATSWGVVPASLPGPEPCLGPRPSGVCPLLAPRLPRWLLLLDSQDCDLLTTPSHPQTPPNSAHVIAWLPRRQEGVASPQHTAHHTLWSYQRHGITGVNKAIGMQVPAFAAPFTPTSQAWSCDTDPGAKAQVSRCRISRERWCPPFLQLPHAPQLCGLGRLL